MHRTQVISPQTLQASQKRWTRTPLAQSQPRVTRSPPVPLEHQVVKQWRSWTHKSKHGFDQGLPDTTPLTLTESICAVGGLVSAVGIGTLTVCILLGCIN